MKELFIEEKAELYDKAINIAETLYKEAEPMSDCNVIIKTIFPEFKELRGERIRNALIKYFTEGSEYLCLIPYNKEQCVAWLEDQGEKKSVEWSRDDEVGLGDALWAIKQASTIAKDKNDMSNLWYAEKWLKSLKQRIGE